MYNIFPAFELRLNERVKKVGRRVRFEGRRIIVDEIRALERVTRRWTGRKEEKKRYYRENLPSPAPRFVKFVIFVGANRDPCFIFMRRVLAYSRHKLLSTARVGSNRYNAPVAEFIRWQGADHGRGEYREDTPLAPHLPPRHGKPSHRCRFLSTMQIPQPRAVLSTVREFYRPFNDRCLAYLSFSNIQFVLEPRRVNFFFLIKYNRMEGGKDTSKRNETLLGRGEGANN